jgi:hypothetical protein
MEFLRSRAFKIYLAATLAVSLLAVLIALVVGFSRRQEAPPTVPARPVEAESPFPLEPESLLLPSSWSSPRPVEPLFYRRPGRPWTYTRIEPFWTSPALIEYESLREKNDRAVRDFLEPLP